MKEANARVFHDASENRPRRGEDAILEMPVETALQGEIGRSMQDVLKIEPQVRHREEAKVVIGAKIDEDIDIAVRPGFAPRGRAEQRKRLHPARPHAVLVPKQNVAGFLELHGCDSSARIAPCQRV